MIRLSNLLIEISLGSVTPYATQFVWRDNWGDAESFEAKFEADSQPITMTMTKWKHSQHGDTGEWQFAYFVRSKDGEGWTTTTRQSAAQGELNTFRLFKTIGEAIRDFANTQPGVDVIDVSGSDTYDAKGAQKTRIYTALLQSNADLAAFKVVQGATRLFLVRKTAGAQPDATGIEDADDYWTPDGSETATDDTQWTSNRDGSHTASF
jgi:hypothetical protein